MHRLNHPLTRGALVAVLAATALSAGYFSNPPRDYRVASVDLVPDAAPPASAWRNIRTNADLAPVETYRSTLDTIHSRYYGAMPTSKEYTTDQVLTYAAIRGMLGSLKNDRYTRFLTPGEYRDMMEENKGEFSGIGAHLDAQAKSVIIQDTIEGSPARRAGLKAGDIIIKVDQTKTEGMRVDDAVKLIRGPRGTPVQLTISRKGSPKPLVFRIVRDTVELETVRSEVLPGNIGYIALTSFNDQSDRRFEKALASVQAKDLNGLIVDLRWNPGGLLEQAVAVGSHFVREGPIVWIKERGGRPQSMEADSRRRSVGDIPVVILINRYSASASEIVAGAVKDNGVGTLVGTTTWGKGLVQTINPLPSDGSAVLITTHRYYTPAMVDINKKGIEPDIEVKVTEKDFAAYQKSRKMVDDVQVQKAMQVIQQGKALSASR